MKHHTTILAPALAVAALLFCPSLTLAQTAPSLRTADSFAVLGATTVTNTGSTVITGDLGLSPGTSVTGFPPGTVSGTTHVANATALQAQNDVTTAYNALTSQPCTSNLTGQDLGGMTLTPGVYCFDSSAQLTGTLTLNAQGNSNAVFIFKIGSTLTTASNSVVVINNGGQNCNVFWQVGSSATLGTNTNFTGNILALQSITLNTSARVFGRTLARNGAVTLDTSQVSRSTCATASCPVITISPATLPAGALATPYSQTITASGGTAPYTFTVTNGALPPGLVLATSGLVSGTPTSGGTYTFTVRATDANGCTASITYSITIPGGASCPVISLTPSTLPNVTIGTAYSQTLTASGGTGPYAFTVPTGALPAGITLSNAGALTGTPTTAGNSTFTIRATDANGCLVDVSFTVTIAVPVPTMSEWMMIGFAGLLGLAGFVALSRRRAVAR